MSIWEWGLSRQDVLGSAYIAGFKRALKEGADFIFEMDADHLHDYNDLPRFLEGDGLEARLRLDSISRRLGLKRD